MSYAEACGLASPSEVLLPGIGVNPPVATVGACLIIIIMIIVIIVIIINMINMNT